MTQSDPIFFHRLTAALGTLVLVLAGAATSIAAPAGQAAPAGHVARAETTAKLTAPIAIGVRIAGTPQIGQPLDLTVSVSAEQGMQAGSLSLTADDPLAIIQPIDTVALGDIAGGQTVDIDVTVLPLVVQTHYLTVTVSGTIGGLVQTRSIQVPIRLAGTGLRKAENEVAGKTTERVRSFEAIETVR
jgi:hypothetical protein